MRVLLQILEAVALKVSEKQAPIQTDTDGQMEGKTDGWADRHAQSTLLLILSLTIFNSQKVNLRSDRTINTEVIQDNFPIGHLVWVCVVEDLFKAVNDESLFKSENSI